MARVLAISSQNPRRRSLRRQCYSIERRDLDDSNGGGSEPRPLRVRAQPRAPRGGAARLRRAPPPRLRPPRLAGAGEVATEEESLAAEIAAEAVSAAIDRRDVPGRETPLHLAVRLRDAAAAEILAAAGADWSLQNERGWSGLQEAVYAGADAAAAAAAIARHHRPFAWARWRRRLPSIVASLARVRDFYMEITFRFESSVVPFLGRFAPSDTYRIWKRGPNLRADTTLAGFDGFLIQRSDQTFLFFGEGSPSAGESGRPLAPGSLIVLWHDEKKIADALAGAGERPTEAEVARELATMRRTTMCRTGIDVTRAKLVPHLNWRRQQRTEVVGNWKAKAYDMLHVAVTVKTRRVPLTRPRKRPSAVENKQKTPQDSAVNMGNAVDDSSDGGCVSRSVAVSEESNGVSKENNRSNKKCLENYNGGGDHDHEAARNLKKFSKSARENGKQKIESGMEDAKKGKEKGGKQQQQQKKKKKEGKSSGESNKHESEYKKAELLTTKLPQDTFPVKIAIPAIPGVRVLVTFTKFEELQPSDEFATPPSSPTCFQDCKAKEAEGSAGSGYLWARGRPDVQSCESSKCRNSRDEADPFLIPSDYSWIDKGRTRRGLKAPEGK
uniref:Ankyrin repeat domain-containing protein n=1 Tax=Ananas comosus var. bracteatus TaxID=296719 RepID=A0A6V7NQR2_ANACO|nr:unnamed protein product [Ananas comosus var. bracteatus]